MAAANAVVGALRVVIGADIAQFEKGLKSADGALKKFSGGISKTGLAIGAAVGGLAVALGVGIKNALEDADKMGKMAQSAGIGVEEFSKLAYAADLAGVSVEELGSALGKLGKNMEAAARDPSSQLSQAFKTLQVNVQNADGSLKASDQVLGDLSEQFSKYKDSAEKTALAIAIFGKAGAALIPFLNGGRKGIEELKKEAERLGIVITEKTFKQAEQFNDNMRRMEFALKGVFIQLANYVVPMLVKFSNSLVDSNQRLGLASTAVSGFVAVLKVLATAIVVVYSFAVGLMNVLAGLLSSIIVFGMHGPKVALETLKQTWTDTVQHFVGTAEILKNLWVSVTDAAEDAAKKQDTANKNAPRMLDAAKLKEMEKEMEDFRKKVFEETRTEAEKFRIEMEKLNKAFENGKRDPETYARAVKKLQDELYGVREAQLAVHSALESAFVDAITQAKSFKDVLGSLIKDLARLAAQSAFRQLFGSNIFDMSGPGLIKIPTPSMPPPVLGPSMAGPVSELSGPNGPVSEMTGPAGGNVVNIETLDARGAQKGVGEEIVGALTKFVDTPLFKQKSIIAIREGQSRRQV